MSLPHLLLVDDSEAVLAYQRAALQRHYTISTATNGREALEKIQQVRPAGVLLDLSMPEMDGDEVLRAIKADPDPAIRRIPVLIVSSEKARAEACLQAGAVAFLHKPIKADDLVAHVGRMLELARRAELEGSLAVLFVGVGPLELGLPLERVRTVVHQPATAALPGGSAYLSELFDLHGRPVFVLDLARRLGVEHAEPLAERKLVVLLAREAAATDPDGDPARAARSHLVALCVDRVRDPEELAREELVPREALGGAGAGLVPELLVAFARTPRGHVAIIDPEALMSRAVLRRLPRTWQEIEALGGRS